MLRPYQLSALAAAIAVTLPCASFAQTPPDATMLEDIIVTVQKKEERLQSIPVAVTAINRSLVGQENITALTDIAAVTPALTTRSNQVNSASVQTSMRGQVYLDGQITGTSPVGMYIDGVYNPRIYAANLELADIDRVEVMRGPQGALYGKNTTGGAINIINRAPQDDLSGKYTQTFGSDGLTSEKLVFDTGRYNGLAARVVAGKLDSDGSIENLATGDYFDAKDDQAFSMAVDYKNDDAGLYVKYTADSSTARATSPAAQLLEVSPYFSQSLQAMGFPGFMADSLNQQAQSLASTDRQTELRSPLASAATENKTSSKGQMLEIEKEISGTKKIKSITGYRSIDIDWGLNFTPVTIGFPGYTYLEGSISHDPYDPGASSSFYSQEFQLLGTTTDASINYVAGLYLSHEDGAEKMIYDYALPNFAVQAYDNTATSDSYGLFGQLNYIPSWDWADKRLTLTGGGRYTVDQKSLDKHGLPMMSNGYTNVYGSNEEEFNNFSPMAAASWNLTESTMVYTKYSTGYNSGGFASASADTSTITSAPYDEETAETVELGLKTQFWNNRARVNVDVWTTDFNDMQIQYIPNQLNQAERVTTNAGSVTNQGLELDAEFLIAEGLTLSAGYAYTDSQFNEVVDVYGNSGPVGANIADEFTMAFTPKDKGYVGLTYKLDKTPFGQPILFLSYEGASSASSYYWTGNDELKGRDVQIDSYGIINGRATLAQIPITKGVYGDLSLWSRNMTDEEYVENKMSSVIGVSGVFAPMRSVGVDLTVKF